LKDQFEILEIDKGFIKACDGKFNSVYQHKITSDVAVELVHNDPLKLKIINKTSKD